MQLKTFSLGLFLAIITSSTALAFPAPEANSVSAPEDETPRAFLVRGRPSVTYSSDNAAREATTDGDPSASIANVNYGASYDPSNSAPASGTMPAVNSNEYYNTDYSALLAALRRIQAARNSWPNSGRTLGFADGGSNNVPVGNRLGFPAPPVGLSMRLMPEGDGASAIA